MWPRVKYVAGVWEDPRNPMHIIWQASNIYQYILNSNSHNLITIANEQKCIRDAAAATDNERHVIIISEII